MVQQPIIHTGFSAFNEIIVTEYLDVPAVVVSSLRSSASPFPLSPGLMHLAHPSQSRQYVMQSLPSQLSLDLGQILCAFDLDHTSHSCFGTEQLARASVQHTGFRIASCGEIIKEDVGGREAA